MDLNHYFDLAMSVEQYNELFTHLVENKSTTGSDKSEMMVEYTALNYKRSNRISKHIELLEGLKSHFSSEIQPQRWLVITEPWCGDAAHNVPMIEKMAALNENIDLKLILRDEHTELIDAFLTNGGRSIPKLIAFDEKGAILFTWGPRPLKIQDVVNELKAKNTPKNEFLEAIQLAYHHDHYLSIQEEFLQLVS